MKLTQCFRANRGACPYVKAFVTKHGLSEEHVTVLASNIEAMLSHHSDKNEEDKEGCQTHRLLNGGMETLAKQRLEDARSLASTGKAGRSVKERGTIEMAPEQSKE